MGGSCQLRSKARSHRSGLTKGLAATGQAEVRELGLACRGAQAEAQAEARELGEVREPGLACRGAQAEAQAEARKLRRVRKLNRGARAG